MFVDFCIFPFPDDAAQRPIRRQVKAANLMAPKPAGMLFLTSLGRHCRLSGVSFYVILCMAQPTRYHKYARVGVKVA
jgi:hypothetical protein